MSLRDKIKATLSECRSLQEMIDVLKVATSPARQEKKIFHGYDGQEFEEEDQVALTYFGNKLLKEKIGLTDDDSKVFVIGETEKAWKVRVEFFVGRCDTPWEKVVYLPKKGGIKCSYWETEAGKALLANKKILADLDAAEKAKFAEQRKQPEFRYIEMLAHKYDIDLDLSVIKNLDAARGHLISCMKRKGIPEQYKFKGSKYDVQED